MSFMDRWPRRRRARKMWIALGSLLIGAYVAAILAPPQELENPPAAKPLPAPDVAIGSESEVSANPTVELDGPASAGRTPPAGGGSMNMVRRPALPPESNRPLADFISSAAPAPGGQKLKLVRSFMPYQSPAAGIGGINRPFESEPFKQRSVPRPAAEPSLADIPMDGDVVANAPLPRQLSAPVEPLGQGATAKELPPRGLLVGDKPRFLSRSKGASASWRDNAIREILLLRDASRRNLWTRLAVGAGASIIAFGMGVILSGLLSALLKIDGDGRSIL